MNIGVEFEVEVEVKRRNMIPRKKAKFPRMNYKQKEYCPTGYVWIKNIVVRSSLYRLFRDIDEYDDFTQQISRLRSRYGDVQVTVAFSLSGKATGDNNIVAVYVPHPAVRRIHKRLRIINYRRIHCNDANTQEARSQN